MHNTLTTCVHVFILSDTETNMDGDTGKSPDVIIDNSSSHNSILQHGIREMLEQSVFMDCHLEVEGKKIACHRLVLGACSPVLQAMLTSGMKELQTSVIPVKLFSVEVMEAVVRYDVHTLLWNIIGNHISAPNTFPNFSL